MKKRTNRKVRFIALTILCMFLATSVMMNFLPNSSNPLITEDISNNDKDNKTDNDIETVESPELSAVGLHSWWNASFQYRKLINVTNRETVDLYNYGVKLEFQYDTMVTDGKMNSSLKDIRIVEYSGNTPFLRKFLVWQDYPDPNWVTVWFDTNVSAATSPSEPTIEMDTYLYYGNDTVESVAIDDGLGWVKNGDFEYIPSGDFPTTDPYDPLGWTWSHDPHDDLAPRGADVGRDYNEANPQDDFYFENRLIDADGTNVQLYEGSYSYKWGSTGDILETTGDDDDFVGVFYSTAFTVPIVGNGNPSYDKIYLSLWRNIRVYGFDSHPPHDVNDGYYLRIINASEGISANTDLHEQIGEYLEYFRGSGPNNADYTLTNYTDGTSGAVFDTSTGNDELTGEMTFDLSDFMGQTVGLEIGMYGSEDRDKADKWHECGYGQIDVVQFTYNVTAALNDEEQNRNCEITVVTRDVDGRLVPYANVTLHKGEIIWETRTTDINGETLFSNILSGVYNFTVKYFLSLGSEAVVFNSTRQNFGTPLWNYYNFTNVFHSYDLVLNMSTIDFEIVDWEGEPLNYGYINISYTEGSSILEKLTLDITNNGKTTFRWLDVAQYYYQVYYDNDDYTNNPVALNASYIKRTNYDKIGEKYQNHQILVNESNIPSSSYYINETIYTNGSTNTISNKKILSANLTLTNMGDNLNWVNVSYIDEDGIFDNHIIFNNNSYTTETSDFILIDIRSPPVSNAELTADHYEVYGILIQVYGTNSSTCNGIIDVNLTETWNIFNRTALSKIRIRVVDEGVGQESFYVIVNSTEIVTLKTDSDGYAYGISHTDVPFWYLNGFIYNFSLMYGGKNYKFNVTYTRPDDPGAPLTQVDFYLFSLSQNSTITFDAYYAGEAPDLSESLLELENATTSATWGEDITIWVNYTYTIDGTNYYPVEEGNVQLSVKSWSTGQIVLRDVLTEGAQAGLYTVTINSNRLSAGYDSETYYFIVNGTKVPYVDPIDLYIGVEIFTMASGVSLHDYNTFASIIEVEEYFGEPASFTIKYYDGTGTAITGAQVYYDWLNLGYTQFYPDPRDNDYYSVTLDTSLAETTGKKTIKIMARQENYTQQVFLFSLDVNERKTTINGKTGLVYESESVWVGDDEYFDYTYRDVTYGANIKIGDLDVYTYTWQELDEDGEPVEDESGTGDLIENTDDTYTLDFETGDLDVGFYYLYITLQEENYEVKTALVYLEVELRLMDPSLEATNLVDDQATVVKGEDIVIEIELIDTTRDDEPLTDATVTLEIGGKKYEFKEKEDGVYEYIFSTDEIDAFFTSQTLTGTIKIEKEDFEDEELDITLVVTMEEIFPGVPTFYFILITTAIVGTIGSLVSYRVIQQARIPHFVKKVRKVKGAIKARKNIPAISITSKVKMIKKLFGDEWSDYGLSLNDALGIVKKGKIKPDTKGPLKRNGGEL